MTTRPSSRQALAVLLMAAGPLRALPLAAQRPERFTAWTAPVFPVAEYVTRRAAVAERLGARDVLLVPSAEGTSGGETFRQLDDFEYFVGLEVPRSMLVIDRLTNRSTLYVPEDDPRFENRDRPNDFPGRPLAIDPALRALSGVDAILPYASFEAFVGELASRNTRILVDAERAGAIDARTDSPFDTLTAGERLAAQLQRAHGSLDVANAWEFVAKVRMRKSPREIATMREAARSTMIAIARGAAHVREGVDERALTGSFTADCMALGAQRVAFAPIIKSGENSLWPWRILGAQYDRRNRTLQRGELVIYDVGCERDHYVSDVGRTFPVGAQFSARQRELVEMVRKVSDAVIAAARPGVTLRQLQDRANDAIPADARRFMQAPLYFGHHLGLSTGDPAMLDMPLAPGMIFTIEPWYYNHEEQVAVFIEDEILITESGSENLTAALPRDADGLERLRAGSEQHLADAGALRHITSDGVLSFTLDRTTGSVRAYDLLNGAEVARTKACDRAESGELSGDDVAFVVTCAGRSDPVYVNTASYEVTPAPPRTPPVRAVTQAMTRVVAGARPRKNEVVVVGTIHGEHRTSTRYSTSVLRQLLEALRPDFVLTEIAPNRLDAAMREFSATGTIVEPRVVRFPEYVDVLFPLTRTMKFSIVPTAGWSKPMDAYRTAALKRIEADPSRRAEWSEYTRANILADSLIAAHGADDPYFINSAAYDSIETASHEPYNRLFNAELGPGGWDNINRLHFGHIAHTLDAHRGEGKRFVITYGAGHKEWFLRELRKRDDVTLLEVAPFLEQIGAKR